MFPPCRFLAVSGLSWVMVMSGMAKAIAQSAPPSDVTIPSNVPDIIEQTIPSPSESVPFPVEVPTPDPSPTLQSPTLEPPAAVPEIPDVTFQVNRIQVLGSPELHPVLQDEIPENARAAIATLIQQSQNEQSDNAHCDIISRTLDALINLDTNTSQLPIEFESCTVTFDDLVRLRSAITLLYTANGYVTSGAFLPNNQDLGDGDIAIQVVEGELERVELCLVKPQREVDDTVLEGASEANSEVEAEPEAVCGSAHLRDSYVRDRLALATDTPLSQPQLEQALQLLQLDPLIQQVNAELTAGSTPGRNILRVRVEETPPFFMSIGTDNYQAPSIGSAQASITVGHNNVLGLGDRLSASYGITDGLDSIDASYAIPLNARQGTLELRYSTDESVIVTELFEELEIRSESETWSLGFRQPLERTPTTEFALGLTLDLRESQTYILGDIPFSFSEGPEDGESRVTVLRFSQDWVDRGTTRVLAARSQFSFGLEAFDATVNDLGTDGLFFSWLGQFQYVQQLPPRLLLLARVDTQLTPDSLLPLERFSLGGSGTVRGYAQNQLVADNGILGSLELRIPLTDDPQELQLTPFFDIGYVWNIRTPDPDPATIASLGLGLRWLITPDLILRVDYGIPLIEVENQGNSLQEEGLSLSLRYQPF